MTIERRGMYSFFQSGGSMKIALLVVICVLFSAYLFAESYTTSSIGLSLAKITEKILYDGYYYSVVEKVVTMNLDLRYSTFSDEYSKLGFNLGLSLLYPISQSADGTEIQTDFFNISWCPQIGLATRYQVTENLTLLCNAGYQILYNLSSQYSYDLETTIRSRVLVHGFYTTDAFVYKVSDLMVLNFGVEAYFPFAGSQKLSASGYGSETLRYSCSGIFFEPFIGFSIKR